MRGFVLSPKQMFLVKSFIRARWLGALYGRWASQIALNMNGDALHRY